MACGPGAADATGGADTVKLNPKTSPPAADVLVLAYGSTADFRWSQPVRRVNYKQRPKGVAAFFDPYQEVWWRFVGTDGVRVAPRDVEEWGPREGSDGR